MSLALPADGFKRHVLAATVAMAMVFLLSAISHWALPASWREVWNTRLGYLAPLDYVVVSVSMAAGGWMAGKRFVFWAVALAILIWLATLATLAGTLPSFGHASERFPLSQVLRLNLASALLTTIFAGTGAWLGAHWRSRSTTK